MDTASPLVTVITPVFNGAAFVAEAIRSVQDQTLGEYEHLIIDDGSTDASVEIVTQFAAEDSRIRLLRNGFEKGPAGARNTGIDMATGRFLAFLDCDDVWYPQKLRRQVDFMLQIGAALSYSGYDHMREDGSLTGKRRQVPEMITYSQLLERNVIGCVTAMIDMSVAGKFFMPSIRMRQDWGLWLKVLRETRTAGVGINESLCAMRRRSGSLSRNKLRATWYNFQVLRRHEGLPFTRALLCVAKHTIGVLRDT